MFRNCSTHPTVSVDGGSSVCLGTAHLTESAQIALSSIRPDDLQLDLMDLKNDTVSVELVVLSNFVGE